MRHRCCVQGALVVVINVMGEHLLTQLSRPHVFLCAGESTDVGQNSARDNVRFCADISRVSPLLLAAYSRTR